MAYATTDPELLLREVRSLELFPLILDGLFRENKIAHDESRTGKTEDGQGATIAYLLSRHFCTKSSCTRLKTTTENKLYSSSDEMGLMKRIKHETAGRCPCSSHVDDRGTTIAVKRSYFVFHSLTRFLHIAV